MHKQTITIEGLTEKQLFLLNQMSIHWFESPEEYDDWVDGLTYSDKGEVTRLEDLLNIELMDYEMSMSGKTSFKEANQVLRKFRLKKQRKK